MNINDVSFSKSLLSATVHRRGAGGAWTLDYLSPLCTPEPSLFLLPRDTICEFCTDHSASCTGDVTDVHLRMLFFPFTPFSFLYL